jgi:AcrR family transcriptional regulator
MTQDERSLATRRRLLDATIDCLIERGYAHTTTPEIATRAGFTRGAQLHHFGGKEELVLAAVKHLFVDRMAELVTALAKQPSTGDLNEAAIKLSWSIFKSRFFVAWLEVIVAGRTDRKLGKLVSELSRRFLDELFKLGVSFSSNPPEQFRVGQIFGLDLMIGMAVRTIVDDRVSEESVLDLFRHFLELGSRNSRRGGSEVRSPKPDAAGRK